MDPAAVEEQFGEGRLAVQAAHRSTLEALGVPHETRVVSAHRTPDRLFEYAAAARDRGLRVIIAGAGGSGGGQIYFWKADGKNEFHKLKMKDTCRDLHLAPDQTHFVTAHYDGHLRICKMAEKSKG